MPELLQDWVTIHAEARPDAIAVVGGNDSVVGSDDSLTYSQLEMLSNRVARLIRAAGCQKADRVCLLMPKSPAAIAGLLGIYKADCTYVPLDPSSPPSRLAKVASACGAKLILVDFRAAGMVEELLAAKTAPGEILVGWMEATPAPAFSHFQVAFTLQDAASLPSAAPARQNKRSDPAHILFTSGSTGNPKGVVITHDNVIPFIEWTTRYFRIESSDRNSGHPPLPFDLSFLDIFGTFAAGARLYPVPTELNIAPAKMADFIRDNELTQWFSVPSVLHYMAKFDVVRRNDFPSLKRLLWCGEVFPTASLIYWMERLPHVQFTNLYGPTEASIASSYYTITQCPQSETAAIPIGTACDDEELLVLNDGLERVPPGVAGNLFIGGVGLSPGYWNDPETTARAFLRSPFSSDPSDRIYRTGDLAKLGEDGLVYFLGRNDTQIKSRGYRIEIGEIEAALNAISGLQESAVVAIGGPDTAIICCAYVPARGIDFSPVGLRKLLSDSLPPYMLPMRWRRYSVLPKNSSGKIDRRMLKEVFIGVEAAMGFQPAEGPAKAVASSPASV